jgi:hypothetical protein
MDRPGGSFELIGDRDLALRSQAAGAISAEWVGHFVGTPILPANRGDDHVNS